MIEPQSVRRKDSSCDLAKRGISPCESYGLLQLCYKFYFTLEINPFSDIILSAKAIFWALVCPSETVLRCLGTPTLPVVLQYCYRLGISVD